MHCFTIPVSVCNNYIRLGLESAAAVTTVASNISQLTICREHSDVSNKQILITHLRTVLHKRSPRKIPSLMTSEHEETQGQMF
jgi:hypothetical protein